MADDIKPLLDKRKSVQNSFNQSMLIPKIKSFFSGDNKDAMSEALSKKRAAMNEMKDEYEPDR